MTHDMLDIVQVRVFVLVVLELLLLPGCWLDDVDGAGDADDFAVFWAPAPTVSKLISVLATVLGAAGPRPRSAKFFRRKPRLFGSLCPSVKDSCCAEKKKSD